MSQVIGLFLTLLYLKLFVVVATKLLFKHTDMSAIALGTHSTHIVLTAI